MLIQLCARYCPQKNSVDCLHDLIVWFSNCERVPVGIEEVKIIAIQLLKQWRAHLITEQLTVYYPGTLPDHVEEEESIDLRSINYQYVFENVYLLNEEDKVFLELLQLHDFCCKCIANELGIPKSNLYNKKNRIMDILYKGKKSPYLQHGKNYNSYGRYDRDGRGAQTDN